MICIYITVSVADLVWAVVSKVGAGGAGKGRGIPRPSETLPRWDHCRSVLEAGHSTCPAHSIQDAEVRDAG